MGVTIILKRISENTWIVQMLTELNCLRIGSNSGICAHGVGIMDSIKKKELLIRLSN